MVEDTERQDDSAGLQPRRVESGATLLVARVDGGLDALPVPSSGVVLGRSTEDSDVGLDDAKISRRHVEIRWQDAAWRLTDLGSRNGGFLDGAPFGSATGCPLHDGAVLRLGNTVAVFRDHPPLPRDTDSAYFPGISNAATAIRKRVRYLATVPGHVLVTGETGTGKERLSRAIAGDRKIVVVNCAELREELVRSELFGHTRGAFSGAAGPRVGLVALAAGGVLFLDEVGELTLEIQADLLRFMEDGGFRPLGASELATSDARIVAATNRDLDEWVRLGKFRRDLLARLRASNQPVELPSLRERAEDILGWAKRFIVELPNAPSATFSAGAIECLLLYPWPDNLRQLRGAMRAIAEGPPRSPIESRHLPSDLVDHRLRLRQSSLSASVGIEEPTMEQTRDALGRARGNMRVTADLLQVDRRKLYRLCERYGIDANEFRKGEIHDA